MRRFMMAVIALAMIAAGSLRAQDLTGNWQGTLAAGKGLRTIVKISKDDGKLKGVLYSIDQSPQPIPLTSVAIDGLKVSFAIKMYDLSYTGTMNAAGTTIVGNTTQGGQTFAMNLDHVTAENTWPIPEAAKPMAKDAQPGFDVVTIKPGTPNQPGKNIGFKGRHFICRNFNVNDMIALAYGLHAKQILGAPEWFDSELFDIDGVPDVEGVPSTKQMGIMLQKLLADRFQLKFHREQRELSVFAITANKGEPKMTVSSAGPDDPIGFGFRKLGDLTVHNMTMEDFAKWMQSSVMDRPVMDQTGLKDRYDFHLKWTPDDTQFAQFRSTGAIPSAGSDPDAPPALNDAFQQQIGLKITAVKAMDDVIVIDHMERPSAN